MKTQHTQPVSTDAKQINRYVRSATTHLIIRCAEQSVDTETPPKHSPFAVGLALAALLLIAALGLVTSASALASDLLASAPLADYAINWFTVDGGGGLGSGGTYGLNASLGQPDAGAGSGGTYTLNGGFWPGVNTGGPVSPTLTLSKATSSPTAGSGQTLTYTLALTATGASLPATLTDTLPAGLTYVNGSATGGAIFNSGQILWNGSVPPGSPVIITYQATVNGGLASGSILANTAIVTFVHDNAVYQQQRTAAVSIPNSLPFAHLVLIYANGDNTLSSAMLALLNNAELSAGNANLVALMVLDGPADDDTWLYRLQGDVDESCPNYVNPTCDGRYIEGQNLWRFSDDTANPYALSEFLKGALRAYPNAGQVLVSLVGHGSGWYPDVLLGQPSGWDGQPGGLLWDEHPGSYLTTQDLGQALRWATQATGRTIDLLYLDACLMSMAEVADEVSDSVAYVLASENWSWAAFSCDAYLNPAVLDGAATPADIGAVWLGIEANLLRSTAYPFTLSLIDTSQLADVRISVEALGVALSNTLPTGQARIEAAHTSAICFDSTQDGPIDANDNYCDLAALAQHLASQFSDTPAVVSATQAVQEAVTLAVIAEDHANGVPWNFPDVEWAWEDDLGGLSLYSPLRVDDWKRAYYNGDHLAFAQGGQWGAFLDAFWNNAAPPAPPPCATCEPPPPAIILPIEATARGGHEDILLTWEWGDTVTDTTGLAGYRVYRNENGGDYLLLTPSPITENQYTDSGGLVDGAQYCYQIKAVNGAGNVIGESNIPCATFGELALWVPDLAAPPMADGVSVPINLDNGNGLCIAGLEVTLGYDADIVTATASVTPTIYTAGYTFIANNTLAGEVSIVALGSNCQPLYGTGTLFDVGFNVITNVVGQVSPLDFLTGLTYTVIYDDGDLINPVPLSLEDGSLTVSNAYSRGDVNGDGAVNVADAVLALQIASGQTTPTPHQQIACDVNGDAACDSADATLILCYAAYDDWNVCGAPAAQTGAMMLGTSNVVTLTLGAVSGSAGQTVTVPINITNGPEFAGGTLTFRYDPTRMTFVGASLSTLTGGFSVQSHVLQPGLVRVALARNTSINADGALLNLQFALTSAPTPLGAADVRLNDEDGRDFETWALQKTIVVAQASSGFSLFLPFIRR